LHEIGKSIGLNDNLLHKSLVIQASPTSNFRPALPFSFKHRVVRLHLARLSLGLPGQARDKHRENSKKARFVAGGGARKGARRATRAQGDNSECHYERLVNELNE
jgi:hypothetical protein